MIRPRPSALQDYESHHGPNMTPMVDVVMVILIFFMAAMSFVGPEWFLRAAVPMIRGPGDVSEPAADPFALPPAIFTLRLERTGVETTATGLGLEAATLDRAAERIRQMAGELSAADVVLQLMPAPDVPYRDVIRVHDEARRAGVRGVGLGALPRPGSSPRGHLPRPAHGVDLQPVPLRPQAPGRAHAIAQLDELGEVDGLDLARVEVDEQVGRASSVREQESRVVVVEEHALEDPGVEEQAERPVDRRLGDAVARVPHGSHERIGLEEPVGFDDGIEDASPLGRVAQPLALEPAPEDRAQRLDDPEFVRGFRHGVILVRRGRA